MAASSSASISNTSIKFYPNPNDGMFTIETNDEQSYQLQVYSLLGELVFEKTVSNNEQINLLHLSSSTYITKIVKDGNVMKTARICIIK
jgi:CRISPR/Cas system-associated protein endoribonuclease Cas2